MGMQEAVVYVELRSEEAWVWESACCVAWVAASVGIGFAVAAPERADNSRRTLTTVNVKIDDVLPVVVFLSVRTGAHAAVLPNGCQIPTEGSVARWHLPCPVPAPAGRRRLQTKASQPPSLWPSLSGISLAIYSIHLD